MGIKSLNKLQAIQVYDITAWVWVKICKSVTKNVICQITEFPINIFSRHWNHMHKGVEYWKERERENCCLILLYSNITHSISHYGNLSFSQPSFAYSGQFCFLLSSCFSPLPSSFVLYPSFLPSFIPFSFFFASNFTLHFLYLHFQFSLVTF